MMDIVGYDTETWSSNQISKGLDHYFEAKDFTVIVAGFANESAHYSYPEPKFLDLPLADQATIYAAHNAEFDRRALDTQFGVRDIEPIWFDTMVGVRAILGASLGRNSYISLDRAAKLLLPEEFHKDDQGAKLMPYFSYPSPYNDFGRRGWREMSELHPDKWARYGNYCAQDAVVARELALLCRSYMGVEAFERLVFEAELTYRMNRVGWPVDDHLLQAMTDRAQENTEGSLDRLIEEFNPGWATVKKNGDEQFKPLNLNSGVQLKKWLAERDIDIENTQADTITETIEFVEDNLDNRPDWAEVLAVLQTKVDLGGATLKKLQPIAKGLSKDGRLRGMYNHIAAASTHRTTGSGVQMQNLKRLPDDVEDLTAAGIKTMNNNELARNIRQLFKAEGDGQIIVADLKSIEGLLVGWVFGVDWMVEAVRDGKDMYKMSAAERFRVPYDLVMPEQRRQAKTGVLAGNYGGGAKAYAKASGGTLTEEEADKDKQAYRETIPNLMQSWWDLSDMLVDCLENGSSALRLYRGYSVVAQTLEDQVGAGGDTLEVTLLFNGRRIFSRLWHGVLLEESETGRKEISYAQLDERKTAATPWKRETSDGEKYRLYGGKLTGTLIQSLARELYFYQLELLSKMSQGKFDIIGQLHDEVVCEWNDQMASTLVEAEATIEEALTQVPWYLENCPVRVKVSHAPRYIK